MDEILKSLELNNGATSLTQSEFNDLFNATKSFVFCDGNYYLMSKKDITEV